MEKRELAEIRIRSRRAAIIFFMYFLETPTRVLNPGINHKE